ncbi:hypothetical protein [Telmatospirillum sp. J64-1]|uniref:hypothetical protein n=1 Tax=Telmatospirillum sp. J64-1 TaxID=2502183 RepID=UPI00210304A4|nr:hypothetical protein [Telmatospirillum sp. J64-1]
MNKDNEAKVMDRRAFLRGIGLGAGTAGAAAVALSAGPAAAAQADTRESSGYRETDHVRAVYAAARF